MSRRIALALSLAILLLAGAVPTSHAAEQTSPSQMAVLAHSYFSVLNYGLNTGNFSDLNSIFTRHATLTETDSIALSGIVVHISTARGLREITTFYRRLYVASPRTRWIAGAMKQTSPTTMVFYAHTAAPRGTSSVRSQQRLTMRNGKIASLVWNVYYVQR